MYSALLRAPKGDVRGPERKEKGSVEKFETAPQAITTYKSVFLEQLGKRWFSKIPDDATEKGLFGFFLGAVRFFAFSYDEKRRLRILLVTPTRALVDALRRGAVGGGADADGADAVADADADVDVVSNQLINSLIN